MGRSGEGFGTGRTSLSRSSFHETRPPGLEKPKFTGKVCFEGQAYRMAKNVNGERNYLILFPSKDLAVGRTGGGKKRIFSRQN